MTGFSGRTDAPEVRCDLTDRHTHTHTQLLESLTQLKALKSLFNCLSYNATHRTDCNYCILYLYIQVGKYIIHRWDVGAHVGEVDELETIPLIVQCCRIVISISKYERAVVLSMVFKLRRIDILNGITEVGVIQYQKVINIAHCVIEPFGHQYIALYQPSHVHVLATDWPIMVRNQCP